MDDLPEIQVMAGVLSDAEGRVLVAQRPAGRHLAGRWEFPGGKLAAGEAPLVGLQRELAEELGVTLESAEPLIRLRHSYADRRILLDAWRVTRYSGTPRGLDSQALDWVAPDQLTRVDLLEADRPIVTALRLPPVARCVSGLPALLEAAGRQPAEALFWDPGDTEPMAAGTRAAVSAARAAGHRVLIAGEAVEAAVAAAATRADGLLLGPAARASSLDPRGSFLMGAQCPTPAAATAAVLAGAHFLVLAPGGERADDRQFTAVFQRLGVPAYVGWYPDTGFAELARARGAHGCAIGPFPHRSD